MEAAYDPQRVESEWYSRWENAGVFAPEINPDGEPFCIVIPPPNVTGSLHMGHALDQSIHTVRVPRNPKCPSCGDKEHPPRLLEEAEYC